MYLRSIHYAITSTALHMQMARQAALALGDRELATYFETKAAEERGHEVWAESDMHRLAQCFGAIGAVSPAPSIVALGRFNERLIEEDPRLFVAYMLCAEYFTVLIGPAWVEALTRGCGVPAAALTVVSKHVEADAAHACEGFSALDRFVAETRTQLRVRAVLDEVFGFLTGFQDDLLRLCSVGSHAPVQRLEPLEAS
jgi:hypothetical protein